MKAYLGVDQGSSSTKAVLVDSRGAILTSFEESIETKFFEDNSVTQDSNEIIKNLKAIITKSKDYAKQNGYDLKNLGLSCQRSAVLAWNEKLEALSSVYTWQSQSTSGQIKKLETYVPVVTSKTGLKLLPAYAATKINLLTKHFPKARVGTLDAYLIAKLTNQDIFRTDHSMAARTMLYNLETGTWDQELCDIFGINIKKLSFISDSININDLNCNDLKICSHLADKQAALFAANYAGYNIVADLGTLGSLILTTKDIERVVGYLPSVFYASQNRNRKYCLEGIMQTCGNSLVASKLNFKELSELCYQNKSCVAFAATNGTGSPYWVKASNKIIYENENASEITKLIGLVENIGNYLVYMLNDLELAKKQTKLLVTGGLSKIDYLMQYIANNAGIEIHRSEFDKFSALGAALTMLPENLNYSLKVKIFKPEINTNKNYLTWIKFLNVYRKA